MQAGAAIIHAVRVCYSTGANSPIGYASDITRTGMRRRILIFSISPSPTRGTWNNLVLISVDLQYAAAQQN
jgi:hypothetical protein